MLARRRLPRAVFEYLDGGADAERTLRANVRAFDEVLLRPRCAVVTPDCDSEDHRSRHDPRASLRARAHRQQPHVLPARRRSRCAGRGRGRDRLHPVDPVGYAPRRGPPRDVWPLLVSALSGRRPRRGAGRDRAGPGERIFRARRHDRHARRRHARARPPQRHPATALRQSVDDAAVRVAVSGAPALAGGLYRRRRADDVPERPARRRPADALRRRGPDARAIRGLLGGSSLDPRRVAGARRDQGRAHRRGCAPRG